MEKYYPPIQISSISELDDKTVVKVNFFDGSEESFRAKVKEKQNGGGKVIKTETFSLPPMGADEAREEA